jgi:hypothetical protein
VKYKASKAGFLKGKRIRAGETFEADSFGGSWAEPVEKKGVSSEAPVSKKKPRKKRKVAKKKSVTESSKL